MWLTVSMKSGGTLTKFDKTRMLESYKEYCQVMGIDDVHGIETVEKLSRRLFEEGFQQGGEEPGAGIPGPSCMAGDERGRG